jgi:predicted small integral membrane protein
VLVARVVTLVMVASLAAFAFVVTFGNIVDYDSNFAFVRHVLSMDTTFPGNRLMHRAITEPAMWRIAYDAIIAAEGVTALAFAIAAVELACSLRSDAVCFRRGKRFVYAGAGVAFLLWFAGFMVVGGEWFAMWQSQQWNGQEAAFRFYITVLVVLIFVNQEDPELRER